MEKSTLSTWGLSLVFANALYLLLFISLCLFNGHWHITGTEILLLFTISFSGGAVSFILFLLSGYMLSLLSTNYTTILHITLAIATYLALFAGLATGLWVVRFLTKEYSHRILYLFIILKPGYHTSLLLSTPTVLGTLISFFIHYSIIKDYEKEDPQPS